VDGYLLVRTRPAKGLLGGMTEVPTTEWTADFDERDVLQSAPQFSTTRGDGKNGVRWRRIPGVVWHVFTHFPLELSVYVAELPATARAPKNARWVKISEFDGEAVPSLMRKVVAHAVDTLGEATPPPSRRARAPAVRR
jgi:A/G-specific adenine glycosylase